MSARTDIHRPSAIVPADYAFVAFDYIGPESADLSFIERDRRTIRVHMEQTGGKYSGHDHGGSCHVCGAHALYTAIFYHAKTNSYIRTGEDCAEKVALGNPALFKAFRERVRVGVEAAAGKRKAQRVLADGNLTRAWEIYMTVGGPNKYEENTIADICSKLVRYGSISAAQVNFLRKLLVQIDERTVKEAARAAETAAASPVPVTAGRVRVEGVVLSIKQPDEYSQFPQRKMLVKHATGYKLWGSVPSNLSVEKGDTVSFVAQVSRSTDDEKFGFFKRPTNAEIKSYSTDPQSVAGRAVDAASAA
jgi:hypothetical protein